MEPPTTVAEALGREIRSSLAWHGLTQSDLARRAVIAPATLSRRLNGDSAFDVGELQDVARILGLNASELLRRAEEALFSQEASA